MLDAASEGEERYPIAGNSSSKEIAEIFFSLSKGRIHLIYRYISFFFLLPLFHGRNGFSLQRRCLFCFFCKKKIFRRKSYSWIYIRTKVCENFYRRNVSLRRTCEQFERFENDFVRSPQKDCKVEKKNTMLISLDTRI